MLIEDLVDVLRDLMTIPDGDRHVRHRASVGTMRSRGAVTSLLLWVVFLLSCRRSDAPTSVEHESDARTSCVDPVRDLETRRLTEGTVLQNEPQVDLDADGAPDPIVTRSGHCGSGGCNWQVYRTNHGCAKWAGSFFGDVSVYMSSRHNGLLDLEVSVRGGWYELDDYHFDGAKYVLRRRRCAPHDPLGEDDIAEVHCAKWDEEARE